MDKNIKSVLEAIENHGYEAYVVGGYVRDYIRGVKSTDIDICTNALPKDINNIFHTGSTRNDMYGAYKMITDKYNYEITTYRKELRYEDRKPIEIEYVNNLITDIGRRDFTINSLVMNSEGTIIDILNGKEDIINKRIRVIGDMNDRFLEDPLRMLRAIRFGTTLDFTIDNEIIEYIKNNKEMLKTLSIQRIKYELDCILTSPNLLKGLNLIKELGLCDILGIKYDKVLYIPDVSGVWAQIEFSNEEIFTKEEKSNINKIKEIVKIGTIDDHVLFKYGLYLCSVAGNILNIDVVTINEMYQKLPITNVKDIKITNNEIISILNIKPSKVITEIALDIKNAILNKTLKNESDEIKKYIISNKAVWLNEKSNRNIT